MRGAARSWRSGPMRPRVLRRSAAASICRRATVGLRANWPRIALRVLDAFVRESRVGGQDSADRPLARGLTYPGLEVDLERRGFGCLPIATVVGCADD